MGKGAWSSNASKQKEFVLGNLESTSMYNQRSSLVIYQLGGQSQLRFTNVWTNYKLTFLFDHLLQVCPKVISWFGFSSVIIFGILYSLCLFFWSWFKLIDIGLIGLIKFNHLKTINKDLLLLIILVLHLGLNKYNFQ